MEQYQTYLRAELGKLSDLGACRELVRTAGPVLGNIGLLADPQLLNRRFPNQGRVDRFVGGLDDPELVRLTDACGVWRENDIAAADQRPELHLVPTERIRLLPAERDLAPQFARCGWDLVTIAKDPTVLVTPPYSSWRPGTSIAFGICLANRDPARPDGYRIFDGRQRAIQTVLNGVRTILLCVVDPPAIQIERGSGQ
ncbi:MAG: hypothetical protein ACRDGI_06240 [Candidatus Limnocylindrales bacterium]